MSQPRKHHYCPQFYLARFTQTESNTGRLYVFDKTSYQSRYSKPKNEAHRRDFYKVSVEVNKDPFVLEKEFSKIEDGAKRGIDFIVKNKSLPSGSDYDFLLNFIGLMAVRTPSHRSRISRFNEQVAQRILAMSLVSEERWKILVSQMKKAGQILPETTYESTKEFFDKGEFTIETGQDWLIQMMLTSASTVIDFLGHRNWCLVFAEKGSSFVCSDNPVGLSWVKEPVGHAPPGFGLMNTQVTIPLTHEVALVGIFENNLPAVGLLKKDGVATFNNHTIKMADRFVYSVSDDFIWRPTSGEICGKDDLERMLKRKLVE